MRSFSDSAPKLEWKNVTINGSAPDFELLKTRITEIEVEDDFGTKIEHSIEEIKYILKLESGARVELSSFGATVTSIMCPDNKGNIQDVVLGFDTR